MFACDWRAAGGNVRLALDILCHAAGGRSHLIARLSLAECRVDDNGVSKIAPSAVVDGQAAAFCHDRLSVCAGYVHWYQRGRDVLSTERRAAIACGGGVADDPRSIASFVAIMLTGRYFNRLGPRPLIIVGCLLQAAGILLLTNVTPATSHRVLMMIFALMGAGGSLCSSTAQSGAFLTIARRDMPDASALWNLNRQISFFLGATLLTLLLNALQRVMSLEVAYRWTFIAAAGITLLPLIYAVCLNNRQALLCLKKERS